MNSAATSQNALLAMIRDIDPHGELAQGLRQIRDLLGEQATLAARTFYDVYVEQNGLRSRLSPATLAKIETQATEYVRHKLGNYEAGEWALSSVACVRHARKHGSPLRAVLMPVAIANEKLVDLIWERAEDEARIRHQQQR